MLGKNSLILTLTLCQQESMMFSQRGLQNRPGQQHSLWRQLCTGPCRLPDVEQSSLWGGLGPLICRATMTRTNILQL